MTIDETRQLGRAKNAVLSYFEDHLSIPKIYIDAEWDGHCVDVLAINRDGVGDVHAVLFMLASYLDKELLDFNKLELSADLLLDRFTSIAANYKYIAIVAPDGCALTELSKIEVTDKFFSIDGMGRVGIVVVGSVAGHTGELNSVVLVKPERFRAKIATLADEYVQQHEADWEIRA